MADNNVGPVRFSQGVNFGDPAGSLPQIPRNAKEDALKKLVGATWQKIVGDEQYTRGELAWLQKIAAHKDATPAVAKLIADKMSMHQESMGVKDPTPSGKWADMYDTFHEELQKHARHVATPGPRAQLKEPNPDKGGIFV